MTENTSIIQIIQTMVQNNEPEETIIKTLESLSVSREQAKRLLLIAQADTFTLLQSEINKIVDREVAEKQSEIEKRANIFVNNLLKEQQKNVEANIEKEFLKHKLKLATEQENFQKNVNETISKIAKLNEDVFLDSKENKKMIDTIQRDLTETKLKGIKLRRSIARNLLMAFGIINLILAFGLVIVNITTTLNLDIITGAVVVALIGAIIIYLSTNM
ncbi:MAG: hypothetical protein WC915_01305 [archaeon]|jgi:hypothetical protein